MEISLLGLALDWTGLIHSNLRDQFYALFKALHLV